MWHYYEVLVSIVCRLHICRHMTGRVTGDHYSSRSSQYWGRSRAPAGRHNNPAHCEEPHKLSQHQHQIFSNQYFPHNPCLFVCQKSRIICSTAALQHCSTAALHASPAVVTAVRPVYCSLVPPTTTTPSHHHIISIIMRFIHMRCPPEEPHLA